MRVFSAYTLYRLYAPHPLAVNPFASVFQEAIDRLPPPEATESLPERFLWQYLDCIVRGEGAKVNSTSVMNGLWS